MWIIRRDGGIELKEKRTSDRVFDHIKRKIADKTWKPGDKITPELHLVEELGVSRMSVREAIEKMVALNILVKRRGGGTYVNEMSPTDYMDDLLPLLMVGNINYVQVLEFRSAIDVLASRLFVERADKESYADLKRCYDAMVENRDNNERFMELDMEFHKIICKGTENPLLEKVIDMIFNIMNNQVRDEYHKLTPEERIEEHRRILEAILEGDAELAQIYMRRHLERTIRDLEKGKRA